MGLVFWSPLAYLLILGTCGFLFASPLDRSSLPPLLSGIYRFPLGSPLLFIVALPLLVGIIPFGSRVLLTLPLLLSLGYLWVLLWASLWVTAPLPHWGSPFGAPVLAPVPVPPSVGYLWFPCWISFFVTVPLACSRGCLWAPLWICSFWQTFSYPSLSGYLLALLGSPLWVLFHCPLLLGSFFYGCLRLGVLWW